jgi:hypothetical protein
MINKTISNNRHAKYERVVYARIYLPSESFLGKDLFNTVITFIEDIVFWTIASIGHILFIYHVNGGVVRIYFIMCTFLGASLYFFSIGKITMYFSVRIIFVVRCLLYWVFRIIIYPINLILRLFKNVARFLALITFIPINNFIRNRRLSSYSKERVSHILLQSKKGFYI